MLYKLPSEYFCSWHADNGEQLRFDLAGAGKGVEVLARGLIGDAEDANPLSISIPSAHADATVR
jgi:hypothetical protein